MKTILALAFLAAVTPQEKDPEKIKVTIELQDASIKQALDMIERISGIPIEIDAAAKKALDPENSVLSIKVQDISVPGALKLLLFPRGCEATWVDKKKFVISTVGK